MIKWNCSSRVGGAADCGPQCVTRPQLRRLDVRTLCEWKGRDFRQRIGQSHGARVSNSGHFGRSVLNSTSAQLRQQPVPPAKQRCANMRWRSRSGPGHLQPTLAARHATDARTSVTCHTTGAHSLAHLRLQCRAVLPTGTAGDFIIGCAAPTLQQRLGRPHAVGGESTPSHHLALQYASLLTGGRCHGHGGAARDYEAGWLPKGSYSEGQGEWQCLRT
jgi:hypothetical protein